MALTDEEKKLARAYNVGYLMSTYEPRLLETIIKQNPKNEFVKGMQVGRDHREFNANIPGKYSREFKNGFFNGRTLAEHQPGMIERLTKSKGLNKDYKAGLESARKEYEVLSIQKKMNKEPKVPSKDLRRDESYQRGFNVGYRFAEKQAFVIEYSKTAHERYGKYLDGMKAGVEQYNHDIEKLKVKNPDAKIFSNDPSKSQYEDALLDHKIMAMDDVSRGQHKLVDRKESFDTPAPKWLDERTPDKDTQEPEKDIDIDKDR